MKNQANILFVGLNAGIKARLLFNKLNNAEMYLSVSSEVYTAEGADSETVVIKFSEINLKAQLVWLCNALQELTGWTFAGPLCPHFSDITHTNGRQYMDFFSRSPAGRTEHWLCTDPACRKRNGITSLERDQHIMCYRDFSMMLHSTVALPEPGTVIPKPLDLKDLRKEAKPAGPVPWAHYARQAENAAKMGKIADVIEKDFGKPIDPMPGPKSIAAMTVHKILTAWMYGMTTEGIARNTGLSTKEVEDIIDTEKKKLKAESVVALGPDYVVSQNPVPVHELQAKRIAELEEKLRIADKQLEEWDQAKLLTRSFYRAADGLIKFLATLNMQDHSIADQREFIEKFRTMKKELWSVMDEQFSDEEEFHAWVRKDN